MKLRDLLLVLVALALLSTLVGIAVLYRLYVWNAPSAHQNASAITSRERTQTKAMGPGSSPGHAAEEQQVTPTPPVESPPVAFPPLVTPTPSPLPSATAHQNASATPTYTLPPTSMATATPTLTPTPALAARQTAFARLTNAHRARLNGEYDVAQAELQSVLQAPETDREAIEAEYQIGIVTYLDGEYQSAQEMLTRFIEQHPEDHRTGAAHFYLAEALTHLGEHTAAIEHYTAYLQQQNVLADLIYTRIARNHLALGAYQAAAEAYQGALEHAPDLGQQYDLREQIALVYSAWGLYDEANVWLRGITERSQNVYRLARIWYLIGETSRLAGQEDEALKAFAHAVNGDPRPGHAHAALAELVNASVEVNEYQRGLIDYYAGSYDAAIAAFKRYIETAADGNSDAHYYLALSYLESGSYDRAVQVCEQAIDRRATTVAPTTGAPGALAPDTDAQWGRLWLLKGQALAEWGREEDAVETYTSFAEANPDHRLAPDAQWSAAQLLEQGGHFRQAADVYTALADAHVNATRAPAARFRAGISRYRADELRPRGDIDAAMVAWQELVNGYPASQESLAARYWLGKVLWSQGQTEKARTMLQALADEYPRDYYGLRAAHLVQGQGQASDWHIAHQNASISRRQSSGSLHLTNDEQAERQEAADWLRSWTDAPEGVKLGDVSTDLAGRTLFRRAMEMSTLSLRAEARETFEQLRKEINQDPRASERVLLLYQLALVTRDLELYAPSMRAAIDLIALAPETSDGRSPSVLDMPRLIQRLAFPTYFSELVLAECATYNLDPLLMFALIRQESVFDAEATSWAGAVGLTQVMPSTGEWIAEMMAWPGYSQEMLQRAYLNVKFGAWFLARIMEQNGGDVMASLAGYNGGPARAQGWQEQAGGDPDLFVEVIARDEPQRYVRLIYRHYDMYVRLYGVG
jgi:soluble lytic murein transglycosylase